MRIYLVISHFRNGAGRSGTLIAIYNSTERLKVEQLIDVPQCVRAIRTVVPVAIGVNVSMTYLCVCTKILHNLPYINCSALQSMAN